MTERTARWGEGSKVRQVEQAGSRVLELQAR